MSDILNSLKKRVTFEDIGGDGPLLDMGLSPADIARIRSENPIIPAPDFRRRLDQFRAQIMDGDELWYYEWFPELLSGTGGYAIVRAGAIAASITTWRS